MNDTENLEDKYVIEKKDVIMKHWTGKCYSNISNTSNMSTFNM